MYVVCLLLERRDCGIYNASVMMDRDGQVAGVYRKVHPTISELDGGVSPGERVEVFETDFGRISTLICFDAMYTKRWREAKELGAEIVFWPSAYEGGLPIQSRVSDFDYYVIMATPLRNCQILDITGYPITSTGYYTDIAHAQIDLDKRLFSTDYNMASYHTILEKYGEQVTIEVLSPEGAFTLETNIPEIIVEDIAREFQLETQQDYFARSVARQDAARS